jgi:hypothetical protein
MNWQSVNSYHRIIGETIRLNMIVQFNTLKSVQAVAVLLKREKDRKLSRLRILKLLYIADRESIAETLRPITGDDVVAMDHGPVLSKTYRLIRGEVEKDGSIRNDGPIWDKYIFRDGTRYHTLACDPGEDLLCEYEIKKLNAVSATRHGMTDYAIADETHLFPEWVKNQPPEGGREPITLHDLLAALDMLEVEASLLEAQKDDEEMASLLSNVEAA